MKTFTARLVTPHDERIIVNATLHKGKLAQKFLLGKKQFKVAKSFYDDDKKVFLSKEYIDGYIFFINPYLFGTSGFSYIESSNLIFEEDLNTFTDNPIFNYTFNMGENPGGYFLYNFDEEYSALQEKEQEQFITKDKIIYISKGVVNYTLPPVLKTAWDIIKPHIEYYIEEMQNSIVSLDIETIYKSPYRMAQLCFSHDAIVALYREGYKIRYYNREINSFTSLVKVDMDLRTIIEDYIIITMNYEMHESALVDKFIDICQTGEPMTIDDFVKINCLPEIPLPPYLMPKHNCYSIRHHIFEDDDFLYVIQETNLKGGKKQIFNEGESYNRAIKIPKTDDVKWYISKSTRFRTKKKEDFLSPYMDDPE